MRSESRTPRIRKISNDAILTVDAVREVDRVALQDRCIISIDLCLNKGAAVIGAQSHTNFNGSDLQVESGGNLD